MSQTYDDDDDGQDMYLDFMRKEWKFKEFLVKLELLIESLVGNTISSPLCEIRNDDLTF